MKFAQFTKLPGATFIVCACLLGCEALHEAGVPGMEPFLNLEAKRATEERYRVEYQETRSPASLQWLLANRVQTGMTVSEVSHVLGQEATREFDDRGLKTFEGAYRIGDKAYRWGPDSDGRSIYLIFREGHLVNFDPREFNEPLF